MLGAGVTAVMVAVQFLEVGLNTMIKVATTNGMSNSVYVVYSNVLAFCILLTFTIFYHRKKAPLPISTSIICRLLLISFLSCAVQNLTYTGVQYSSPTLASAMTDLIPAFTFILAVISRMENVDLKLKSSQAKSIGTVVSITGALVMTLYKGLPVTSGFLSDKVLAGISLSGQSNWLLGGFLLAVGSLLISVLLIVQTWTIKDYPEELLVTTICCGVVVILSAIVALVEEGFSKAWILRPDIELIAIVYSAIFVISIRSVVYAWACRKKGPVYVAVFNPLGMIFALLMGIIFLGDTLHLGSIIGGAIIAVGFYAVIWGMAQEERMVNEKNEICTVVSSQAPLLQNRIVDV